MKSKATIKWRELAIIVIIFELLVIAGGVIKLATILIFDLPIDAFAGGNL